MSQPLFSENLDKAILAAIPTPFLVLDDGLIVQSANKAFYETFKVGAESAEQKHIYDIGNGQWNIPELRRLLEDVLLTSNHIENFKVRHRFETLGERVLFVNARCVEQDKGMRYILLGMSDITEASRFEGMLRESEQFARDVIESSPDCIKVLDLEGRLESMNQNGCKLMEVDDFSLIQNSTWTNFWKNEGFPKAKDALDMARGGQTSRFEGLCGTAKGTEKWWEVVVAPIKDKTGATKKILSISRDITDRVEADSAIREAREAAESANIAKTEFLTNMSHEIRTPMNAIIGLSHILSRTDPLSPRQRQFIETLQSSADGLLILVNDLLDISKIEARGLELEHVPFNLAQLIHEIISMMSVRANEKGLQFMFEGECAHKHEFLGDPTRLRQVIVNLCSNAIKFTDQGTIDIRIVCQPGDQPNHEKVCIDVRDSGIGIAEDNIGKIFEKFSQADASINRRYGGTGLGLAITKTLIETMGGSITVESALGLGSTFTICLPLELGSEIPVEAAKASAGENISSIPGQGEGCVLIVEDYEANILVAESLLEQFGYDHKTARNGADAVEMAKTGQFDLMLMDIQMHGMNGLEATSLIRQLEKMSGKHPISIIGMTAHAMVGDRERCLAAGMDDYLSKPIKPGELQAKILKLLNSARQRRKTL